MFTRRFVVLALMLPVAAIAAQSQSQDSLAPDQQQAPSGRGNRQGRGLGDGPAPFMGKITSLRDRALELSTPDGATAIVKLSDKTEFRKDNSCKDQ